jgi:hypothetical protein
MRLALLYLFLIISGFGPKTIIKRWVVVNGCALKVDGSTNINSFSCAIVNYGNPDTIVVYRNPNQPVVLRGEIRLPVGQFDCRNPIMTADLRKTLKANKFPHLAIRFLSIKDYPEANITSTRGGVTIELAGVSKTYDVDYKVIQSERNYISLVGIRDVNFSDFNISPPTRIGGMIKTKNQLNVVFNLKVKVLD